MAADYELGIGLRQRAQLRERIGRVDEARADAATAERYLAADS